MRSSRDPFTPCSVWQLCWFANLQINLSDIIHFDEGIRTAGGTRIMGHQLRDSFYAHKDLSRFARSVLGLLRSNMMNSKVTTGVTDQTEISLWSCQR